MTTLLHSKAPVGHRRASPPRPKKPTSTRWRAHAAPGRRLIRLPTPVESHAADAGLRLGLDFSGVAVFERLFLRMPVRLLRAGNNVLDLLFYDVHAIPAATRRSLLRWSDPDGSILVVHPGDGDRREVSHFEHVEDFLASADAGKLDVVAIAGVGSSALGTAALAANAADALGRPVVGIVSGYGLADAVAEGLVGWFVLRPLNQLRQLVDSWFAPLTPALRRISTDTQPNGDPHRLVAYVRGLPETDCLDLLLALPKSPLAVMVGHSKGNLSIATALDNLPQEEWRKLCPRLEVTTLGALVELPASLAEIRQFMGMLDAFGLMNSTLPQAAVLVPWATHTLNTRLPFHLAARDALERRAPMEADSAVSLAPPATLLPGSWLDPSRLASDWIDLCTGNAIAIGAAFDESLRSLRQGFEQTVRGFAGR